MVNTQTGFHQRPIPRSLCTSHVFISLRTIQEKKELSLKLISPVSYPIYLKTPQAKQYLTTPLLKGKEAYSNLLLLSSPSALPLLHLASSWIQPQGRSLQQSFPYCLPLLLPPGGMCWQPCSSGLQLQNGKHRCFEDMK